MDVASGCRSSDLDDSLSGLRFRHKSNLARIVKAYYGHEFPDHPEDQMYYEPGLQQLKCHQSSCSRHRHVSVWYLLHPQS